MKFFDGYIQHKREMFLGEQGKLITDDMFKKYVEKYGEEKAVGYLHAINDFTAQFEVILGGGYCRDGVPQSGNSVRTYTRELVNHNKTFLSIRKSDDSNDFKL